MNGGQAGCCKGMQMTHAIAIAIGEGLIRSLDVCGNAPVSDAEVADVQLVDTCVVQTLERRRTMPIPREWLGGARVQIGYAGHNAV